ncbi:uncharacterized protein CcaverHIS019_0409240 [Cutaneotrichosporon cavernicola]|uniref:Inositol-1-monophosphatase n=1 Tax=Cutaneotrichosporon cavernicola TaxID=279322 RepID=A0AA48L510_9TREE|nr:uncharacterized protein CcaverHIS019_0409240 [Cutaneotrichosporon cavernicola]BEI92104.1 hypothetical protein CcaverHIS019_0409240 [Cutaneotrichosporon cavernicola]BEI99874.1 hypothetical protein CcaverHIS631_0409170 [Cutaneotrichosporon cavernicola]BEJ07649.1 hypothetical protein CcaverHIS641_0409180 [Cutaneotrichosporon cavernicola]
MTVDLDAALKFAISIAKEAGQMMRDGQARRFSQDAKQEEKANSVDLVTECDQQVEKFLVAKIKAQYPDHKFIGEESYDGEQVTGDPTWIGDPIDGTTNFIHGFPMVATSIGLAVGGVPVLGVIYNPFLDLLYTGAEGRGAYMNESIKLPTAVRSLDSLSEALVAVEYGSSRRDPALSNKLDTFKRLTGDKRDGHKMVHSLRSVGSAALNICFVAAGQLDAYWEIGCWPWDVCAGMAILKEAGGASYAGKITEKSFSGEPNASIMAGRKYLFVRQLPAAKGETVRAAQAALAKQFYDIIEEWDPAT